MRRKLRNWMNLLFKFQGQPQQIGLDYCEFRTPSTDEEMDRLESNLNSLWCVINCQENNALKMQKKILTDEQTQRLGNIIAGLIAAKQAVNRLIQTR